MKYVLLRWFATLYTVNQVGINAWRTPTMNFSWSMIAWSTNLCQAIIFNPTVLSLPLRFQGSFQLYIQIDDEDRIGGVGSTDRVADIYIHKNLNNSSPLSRMTYHHGVMNHITIELSFQVVCGRNFNGIDCSECIPGWTSPSTSCLTGKLILGECRALWGSPDKVIYCMAML